MAAKFATLIVGLGLIACVLLGIRQLRAQSAHQMAAVQRRVAMHDRELWKLRTEIAKLVTPDRIEPLTRRFGEMASISPEAYTVLARLEAIDTLDTASLDAPIDDRR